MGSILGGISLQSLTRAYGGTFLCFSDYMRPAVRIAALMKLPAIYVWTHDSIGLGEDGPDPPAGRAPRRPARDPRPGRRPPGRRQRDGGGLADDPAAPRPSDRPDPVPAEPAHRRPDRRLARARPTAWPGAPTSWPRPTAARPRSSSSAPDPRCRSPSTRGSSLQESGIATRVVSMPCREWFDAQDQSLPRRGPAAVGQGPRQHRGRRRPGLARHRRRRRADRQPRALRRVADQATLYREFGLTAEAVADAARDSIATIDGSDS